MAVAPEIRIPKLDFGVQSIEAADHAVVPTLLFRLRIDAGTADIRALALNVQVRIEAQRRRYDEAERARFFELFGPPADWGRTLRSLHWTNTTLNVPAFRGGTTVDLAVPCTYDFEVVASKYLQALDDGEVPLELLFSGTVFFTAADGRLQVVHVPWDRDVRTSLPVGVWRDALERAFPGTAWLRLRRDVFDRLQQYKSSRALLTWEATIGALLEGDDR